LPFKAVSARTCLYVKGSVIELDVDFERDGEVGCKTGFFDVEIICMPLNLGASTEFTC
jgi:hypothetical protein